MSFNRIKIASVFMLTAVIIYGGFAWKDNRWPFMSQLLIACEERLVKGLKSPSSYKRISVEEIKSRLDADAYDKIKRKRISREDSAISREFELLVLERSIKDMLAGRKHVYQLQTTIKFDANNLYGAVIRGTAYCGFLDDNKRSSPHPVLIDFTMN